MWRTGAQDDRLAPGHAPTAVAARVSLVVLSTALTLSLVSLAFGTAADRPPARAQEATAVQVASMLTADMTAPGEARPHGVPPSYDWAKGPRRRPAAPPAGFSALTAWGQLYRCAGTAFDGDDTIEVRDLETWTLVGTYWTRVQRSSAVGGSAFPESYVGPAVTARVVARTSRATKVRMRAGYNFHFWPGAGRVGFDPRKVRDLAVVVRARRIAHGASAGCFALSMGADYWRTRAASAGGSMDAGIGRFKRVGSSWRAFSMTTASASTLARHPLPIRLPARELR
jgi:hypothetical protein